MPPPRTRQNRAKIAMPPPRNPCPFPPPPVRAFAALFSAASNRSHGACFPTRARCWTASPGVGGLRPSGGLLDSARRRPQLYLLCPLAPFLNEIVQDALFSPRRARVRFDKEVFFFFAVLRLWREGLGFLFRRTLSRRDGHDTFLS